MPTLTRLERAQDICLSRWRNPDTGEVSSDLPTPVTAQQIQDILRGANPPRPAGLTARWVFVSATLQRMFTNGRQSIGPNEVGDISGWNGTVKAPEQLRGLIQEVGEDPVEIRFAPSEYTRSQDGAISTTTVVESDTPTRTGKIARYTILNDVAVKVGER